MNFPVVIHKDKKSDYGVTVPALPGCFSAGRTLDEALAMAKEAIELHLEGMIEDGQVVPTPLAIEKYQANPEFRGGTWAVISVDQSKLRTNARRINITMPERVLDAVDRAAAQEHDTRSGLLAKAATAYLNQRKPPRSHRSKPRFREALS